MTRRRTTESTPEPITADSIARKIIDNTRSIPMSGIDSDHAQYTGSEVHTAREMIRFRNNGQPLDVDLALKKNTPLARLFKKAVIQAENEARFR